MKLLALDTATDACSAALYLAGEIRETSVVEPRGHARLLLPMVEELLAGAGLRLGQLDGLAFGRGPGAFTGLRIAAGVAQGLALGADLPVLPVSDLAALAQGGLRLYGARRVLACLDARMQEVYWGAFTASAADIMGPDGPESLGPPDAVQPPAEGDWLGIGPGWQVYGRVLQTRCAGRLTGVHADLLPRARDIATLGAAALAAGQAVPPEQALPVYLRDQVTHKPA